MNNEDLIKELIDSNKKQLLVLEDILREHKDRKDDYADYLEGARKANEEFRASLVESAEETERNHADRIEQHQTYLKGAAVTRFVNYVRAATSLFIAGIAGYIIFFGVKVQ